MSLRRYSPSELQFLHSQRGCREGHGLDGRELRLNTAATRCHCYFVQEVAEPALSISYPTPNMDAPCCKGPAKVAVFVSGLKTFLEALARGKVLSL